MDPSANLTSDQEEARKAVPALLNISGVHLPNGWSNWNYSKEVNPSGDSVGSQEFTERAKRNWFLNCAQVRGPAGCVKALADGHGY
jgi:hypothetical protein